PDGRGCAVGGCREADGEETRDECAHGMLPSCASYPKGSVGLSREGRSRDKSGNGDATSESQTLPAAPRLPPTPRLARELGRGCAPRSADRASSHTGGRSPGSTPSVQPRASRRRLRRTSSFRYSSSTARRICSIVTG